MLTQFSGLVNGSFKVTEQGEVILARYGQPVIAERHLEQVSSAVLLASSARIAERNAAAAASYRGHEADWIDEAARGRPSADWSPRTVSSTGSRGSARSGDRRPAHRLWPPKRGLNPETPRPRETPETLPTWRPCYACWRLGGGPGPVLGMDLADLRAIPGSSPGSQTRLNLPGWYGLGRGWPPSPTPTVPRCAPRLPRVAVVRGAHGQRQMSLAGDGLADQSPLPCPRRPGRPDRDGAGRA